MKGISPLIAAVIMIAFVIAVMGIAGSFIMDLAGYEKASVEEGGEASVECGMSIINIKSVALNGNIKVTVENLGQSDLSGLKIVAYTPSGTHEYDATPGSVSVGSKVTISSAIPAGSVTKVRVNTNCPAVYDEYDTSLMFTELSGCQDLDVPNAFYTMTQDVGSDGTCFNVLADGITLDCGGYTINYSRVSTGHAVNVTNHDSVTVRDCVITQENPSVSKASAINFETSSNGDISNNVISVASSGVPPNAYAIWLHSGSNNNTINGNSATASGTGGIGIHLEVTTQYNNITNNVANDNAYIGVALCSGAYFNYLSNNTAHNNIERAFHCNNCRNNVILGGSYDGPNVDYWFQQASTSNYFWGNNFTEHRKIYIAGDGSWFRQSNETTGGIWLDTTGDKDLVVERELMNWNQSLVEWNESDVWLNAPTLTYNISGLLPYTYYNVYNNSMLAYSLQADSSGVLPGFSVKIDPEQNIKVKKVLSCGSYINFDTYLEENVTGCTDTIFYINASDVTLDCQNHYLQSSDRTGINNTGFDNVTIKNCIIDIDGIGSDDGIYFYSADNGTMENNTIYVDDDRAVWLNDGCNGNKITGNRLDCGGQDCIRIFMNSDGNNITNNNITGATVGISVGTSDGNNITNNNIKITATMGIYIYNSLYTNVTGGSISAGSQDYYLYDAGSTNSFRDTNFTAPREIYFHDSTNWFNYNNKTIDEIWVNTSVSAQATIEREISQWRYEWVMWNDTNITGTGIIMTYNISGLLSGNYDLYNNSIYFDTLTADVFGVLPSFTVFLNGEHEIRVDKQ